MRDKVFVKLCELAPAKLEGKRKGDFVSPVTADVELLEVFYAHTLSPIAIAFIVSTTITVCAWTISPALGALALASYLLVGVAAPLGYTKFS